MWRQRKTAPIITSRRTPNDFLQARLLRLKDGDRPVVIGDRRKLFPFLIEAGPSPSKGRSGPRAESIGTMPIRTILTTTHLS